MHGVQPNANARPTNTAPIKLAGLVLVWPRASFSRNGILTTPMAAAEDDQQHAGDLAEDGQPFHPELTEVGRRRTQRDEDQRKAEDEEEGGDDPLPLRTAALTPVETATARRRRVTGMPRISSRDTPG